MDSVKVGEQLNALLSMLKLIFIIVILLLIFVMVMLLHHYYYYFLSKANLRTKVTHSMQTNLSNMRRDNVSQVYLPK